MGNIKTAIQIVGYAWLDDEGDVVFGSREDLQDDPDKPEDATPVVIEITPSDEWIKKRQQDPLVNVRHTLEKFAEEYRNFEKLIKAEAGDVQL
jgi:hypothetical protein